MLVKPWDRNTTVRLCRLRAQSPLHLLIVSRPDHPPFQRTITASRKASEFSEWSAVAKCRFWLWPIRSWPVRCVPP